MKGAKRLKVLRRKNVHRVNYFAAIPKGSYSSRKRGKPGTRMENFFGQISVKLVRSQSEPSLWNLQLIHLHWERVYSSEKLDYKNFNNHMLKIVQRIFIQEERIICIFCWWLYWNLTVKLIPGKNYLKFQVCHKNDTDCYLDISSKQVTVWAYREWSL